ncbi:YtxH domain-containing protein [Oligella ureolytica]
MKARKLTLLAAILSAFALAACDKAEDTAAPVEPPVSEAPLTESPAVEPSPIDEANTLPEAAPESEFSQTVDEAVDAVKETTEELVESVRETAAAASEKVKELTDSAIETTKQATEEAKAKAEEAVENVRQSFSSETGVSDATGRSNCTY